MSSQTTCPQCGKALKLPAGTAGRRGRCPACQTVFVVPAAGTERRAALIPAARAEAAPGDRSHAAAPAAPPRPGRIATPPRPAAAPVPVPRLAHRAAMAPAQPQRHLYWVFALALLPLVFSLLSPARDTTRERLAHTLQAHPDLQDKLDKSESEAEFFAALPGGRIDGAHLRHDTWRHWGYALLAAGGFLGAIVLCFERGQTKVKQLVLVGLFTGTLGILFLLAVQFVAACTQGVWLRGRGLITLLFYIVKFIGFSYRSALDPDNGFALSFLGFTFGVGLCEELTKALPLLWRAKFGEGVLGRRSACALGLASGVGFGISEAITYSSDFYNGVATGGIYVVRFVSCVALHATWGASVGLLVQRRQADVESASEWSDWALLLLCILGVPMLLHGLYDTMLKRDMHAWALVVALASFLFLAALLEWNRRQEGDAADPAAA